MLHKIFRSNNTIIDLLLWSTITTTNLTFNQQIPLTIFLLTFLTTNFYTYGF